MSLAQNARMDALAGVEMHTAERRSNGLRELAIRYVETHAAMTDPACPDSDYNRRMGEYWAAQKALQTGFAELGLDAPLLDSLGVFL